MSTTDDFKAIVARLRGWGFKVVEHSGCYGRSNGSGWSAGKPVGHVNHHYVCSMNPDQSYINSLVSSLASGSVINWFTDVNGVAYLIGTGPANHAGTGNSSVLNRTKQDQANYSVAGSSGDISGNSHYSGTEAQHPGDATPWPDVMLQIVFAINAAEFMQWGYKAERAINHYAWSNRKIDMSWMGGVDSGSSQGKALVENVQRYMSGNGGDDDMPLSDDDIAKIIKGVWEHVVSYEPIDPDTGHPGETKKATAERVLGYTRTDAQRAAYGHSIISTLADRQVATKVFVDGKETAKEKPYFTALGDTGTYAARAAENTK